jgi:KAP-like P-loop domain-containing protein
MRGPAVGPYGRPAMATLSRRPLTRLPRPSRDQEAHDLLPVCAHDAREAALEAVSGVVAGHLRDEHRTPALREDPARPLIMHIDGPGKSSFLKTLAGDLEPEWTIVTFDAWQHQRLDTPWWWLINAIDRELRMRFRDQKRWLRKRVADVVGFRLWRLLRDAVWIVPGLLALMLAGLLWGVFGHDMHISDAPKIVGGIIGAAGGFASLLALATTFTNAIRRHLLTQSPRGAAAVLRRSDPMEDLLDRYGFLVKTAGTPILVLIENLDRCRAEYVVNILEGIQTLLRIPPGYPGPKPLVAFAVAADQGWLCESYVHVYNEFDHSAVVPGRPFGQSFLDKIFDVALRVPNVPSHATVTAACKTGRRFEDCQTETAVRSRLARLEAGRGPVFDLRVQAVRRIGALGEHTGAHLREAPDTARALERLRIAADLGKVIDQHLDTSYCVQRTSLLLGGFAVDHDEAAIARLGQWTMLVLCWPLLAAHLARKPDDLLALRAGTRPAAVADDDLAPLFACPVAVRFAGGIAGVQLAPSDVRAFTTPRTRGSAAAT